MKSYPRKPDMISHHIASTFWSEWEGDGYEPHTSDHALFVTDEHVILDREVVLGSLAVYLQQAGIADSKGEGYKMLDGASTSYGFYGYVDEEPVFCSEDGETAHGETVERLTEATWVEVYIGR